MEGVGHGVVIAHIGLQFGGRQGFGHTTGLQPDKPGGIVTPGERKKINAPKEKLLYHTDARNSDKPLASVTAVMGCKRFTGTNWLRINEEEALAPWHSFSRPAEVGVWTL